MNKKYVCFLFICLTKSVFADFVCDTNNSQYLFMYEQKEITCDSGYFLPADSLSCVTCPTGFSCSGGTFYTDPFRSQGFTINSILQENDYMNNACGRNFPDFFAVYELNVHTCTQGYYLPANVDECTMCPQNNICPGGEYTFNETTNQGIESCPSGTPFAPMGSAVCYPHRLHIGDDVIYLKSTKLTTPSLNVGMDDGIFYANMTTTPTVMNSDTEHYLKMNIDGVIYYVCDDTSFAE